MTAAQLARLKDEVNFPGTVYYDPVVCEKCGKARLVERGFEHETPCPCERRAA